MEYTIKSIRPFIGAKNFETSRNFYLDLGFTEFKIPESKMSLFSIKGFGFYLQNAYVKDWVDNSMLFLEVENLEDHLVELKKINLEEKYTGVRISKIHHNDWGNEFFIHDPSGILWHIGEFNTNP